MAANDNDGGDVMETDLEPVNVESVEATIVPPGRSTVYASRSFETEHGIWSNIYDRLNGARRGQSLVHPLQGHLTTKKREHSR
jgi:hypothetical protein